MNNKEALKTLEDLQRLLTNYRNISPALVEANGMAIQALEEIEKYREIGTVQEFAILKQKNVPEVPLFVPTDDTCLYHNYECPSCGEWLPHVFKPYRCKCGQLLNWKRGSYETDIQ